MSLNLDKKISIKKLYLLGFVWSVLLTLAAYAAVLYEMLSADEMLLYVSIFAIMQVFVQLYFFLHLGDESKPRWNLWTMLFMLSILLVIVIGSIWVMHNLDYNMMPAKQMDEHMLNESQRGF